LFNSEITLSGFGFFFSDWLSAPAKRLRKSFSLTQISQDKKPASISCRQSLLFVESFRVETFRLSPFTFFDFFGGFVASSVCRSSLDKAQAIKSEWSAVGSESGTEKSSAKSSKKSEAKSLSGK